MPNTAWHWRIYTMMFENRSKVQNWRSLQQCQYNIRSCRSSLDSYQPIKPKMARNWPLFDMCNILRTLVILVLRKIAQNLSMLSPIHCIFSFTRSDLTLQRFQNQGHFRQNTSVVVPMHRRYTYLEGFSLACLYPVVQWHSLSVHRRGDVVWGMMLDRTYSLVVFINSELPSLPPRPTHSDTPHNV